MERVDRRRFIKLTAVATAMSLMAACSQTQGLEATPQAAPAIKTSTSPKSGIKITDPKDQVTVRSLYDVKGIINRDLLADEAIFIYLKGIGDPHLHPQTGSDQQNGGPGRFLDSAKRLWVLDG